MNLEDVLDPEYGPVNSVHSLQQDEWSLSKPTFGEEGQIEVVGWSGRDKAGKGNKFYILKCNKCSKDIELFGEGYFRSPKGSLVNGTVPCGCTTQPRWTQSQYSVRCSRKVSEDGIAFLGFSGEWKGNETCVKLSCGKHEWCSVSISNLLVRDVVKCPKCMQDRIGKEFERNSTLKQDSWSITQPRFGDNHHLTVLGWSGRYPQGTKIYKVSCNICSKDTELFGTTGFEVTKANLLKGTLPCGCGKSYIYNQSQMEILCTRKVEGASFKFLGFVGEYAGAKTKILVECPLHGKLESTRAADFLRGEGSTCRKCAVMKTAEIRKKSDEDQIQTFRESGYWSENTSFWRSERVTPEGYRDYWQVVCGDCGVQNEAKTGNLRRGIMWCGCTVKTKPDDVMITSFFASGAFHPDTEFWRSDREDNRGGKPYWYMSCPECLQIADTSSSGLQRGDRPCGCNRNKQKEGYINWLIDDHNNAVAIKFGIARDSKQRIKSQNRYSAYTLKQHSIYVFPSVEQCKQAERECKKELETGVVLKRDMPDGYSETTHAYNIGKVKTIYERNGGVLV